MESFIVILVLIFALSFGIYSSAKHFKGEGGCCGGGSYKPKKKKLSRICDKKIFAVEGMTCAHCKARVEEAVNDIPSAAVRVNLKLGELTVLYAEDISDDVIISKIEHAGYKASRK